MLFIKSQIRLFLSVWNKISYINNAKVDFLTRVRIKNSTSHVNGRRKQILDRVQFSSVTQSCPTLCDPINRSTPGLPVHHQLPEFTQTQCPSNQWCHPAISSSVVPFSSCAPSLPASESFAMSQHFSWSGQNTGVSALASFLPKKSQGWSPPEWTGFSIISLS